MSSGIVLIIGKRGTGKSRLARLIARQALRSGRVVLVHDPMADWQRWGQVEPMPGIVYTHLDAEIAAQEAIAQAPCTLIYDEIRVPLPGLGTVSDTALDIVTYGRHYPVGLVGCTQRPALVSNSLRALISQAYVFQLTNHADLKWCELNLDDWVADRAGDLVLNQFIVWP